MLWFEPEHVKKNVPTAVEHPEYFLEIPGKGDLLLDLGNENAWQYCFDTVAGMIEEIGIDCYRQDFNTDPLECWCQNDAEDRLGITEIKEEEIMAVAEATAVDTVGNMPFAVTAKDIYAAILAADAIGRTML